MPETTFFRLLKTPIDAKGDALAARIAALNAAGQAEETFTLDPVNLTQIPGSPFAYWVTEEVLRIFEKLPAAEGNVAIFRRGLGTNDDFRFLRLWWEATPEAVGCIWWLHAKGGPFSPYYCDLYLLVDWEKSGIRLRQFCRERGYSPSRDIRSESLYFRPGLTWPRRTNGFSVRVLPANSIFGDKGPAVFVPRDEHATLLALVAVMNSTVFEALIRVQLARTELAQSYEAGLIQNTPVPDPTHHTVLFALATLAREAHDLRRACDCADETAHAFCLPGLVQGRNGTLLETSLALEAEAQTAQARLAAIHAKIDGLVFDLYDLNQTDRALVRAEMEGNYRRAEGTEESLEDLGVSVVEELADEEEEGEAVSPQDVVRHVQDLLMWCVGVAFGRWDVRMVLDPTLLPALQGPFDPLPRCAPGALVGIDGLPPATAADIAPEAWLRARKNVLDLPPPIQNPESQIQNPPVAWDGILVDDPTHPADVVGRVRGVLALVWGERADAVEREACDILRVKGLRDYFRDPRGGFFPFHIKRYSKSRRKAPIYWLLQSDKRNYALWLYAHRLTPATLYTAGRDYADAKVALEQARLEELRQGAETLSGSARKRREGEIEQQRKLVAEVADFRKRLDASALLNLPPDLNDGVVISIAPLRELVPWKEAERVWRALLAGEYPWSTMAKQMRERGLVRREA